jgi:hypothetical protein
LSALAVGIFLSIRPVFQLLENALQNGISPSGATLIAAILGFSAVAWQTRQGFKNIVKSQDNQARLDRESREDQSRIAHQHKLDDWNHEKRALAASLCGELSAAATRLFNTRPILSIQKLVYQQIGDAVSSQPVRVASYLSSSEPRIFAANAARIGVLGPSIASDVVEMYQILLWSGEVPAATTLTGTQISKLFEAQLEALDDWIQDQHHVNLRLLSLYGSQEDPGPLYFERQKRKKSGVA